nr:MAG: nonstructural protein [Microviridae sp.]
MSKKIYSIRDIKSTGYLPCFSCENHVEATRQIQRTVKNPQTLLGEFPEDFEVYYLGDFDQQSGIITPLTNPQFLTSVKALLELIPKAPLEQRKEKNHD